METGAVTASAPEWSTIDRDILCPLCDYNLRGLIEPRCPECGHQFVWLQMLDDREHQHPYLFEHSPRRNRWSFVQTLLHSMMPRRFWRTAQPIHRTNPRRLIIYWLMSAVGVIVLLTPTILMPVYQFYAQRRMQQQSAIAIKDSYPQLFIQRYGSLQDYKNRTGLFGPPPPFWWVVGSTIREQRWLIRTVLPCVFCWIAWPWLTFASLLAFRASLRQARIRNSHVLRCAIYSADGGLILGPVIILLVVITMPWHVPGYALLGNLGIVLDPVMAFIVGLLLLVLTYRLAVSYRLYLRFPHAIATVLASQIMVALALAKLFFWWKGF